jgi:carboxypeptidase Taq
LAGLPENFREVVQLSRQEAQLLASAQGCSPYDALMNKYEPGMQSADIDRIFGAVKQWLPGLMPR